MHHIKRVLPGTPAVSAATSATAVSLVFLTLFSLVGCLSATKPDVSLSPVLDKRLSQISPLPITAGIYIESTLRNYKQEEWLRHYNVGIHRFVFPIGTSLSSKIEGMARSIFKNSIVIDNLQNKECLSKEPLDGILTIGLTDSEIELSIEESVWRAIGKHKLSVTASFLDSNQNKIWGAEIAVEGKGFDFITSKIEYEWWVTSGPNFAPAVDDAIQRLTYKLAQKITASEEISDYIHKKQIIEN